MARPVDSSILITEYSSDSIKARHVHVTGFSSGQNLNIKKQVGEQPFSQVLIILSNNMLASYSHYYL